MLMKNPRERKKIKTRYEKHIELLEVFLEAVPTVFVMICDLKQPVRCYGTQ